MEAISLLFHGFAVLMTWKIILLMLLGLVLGIFVGVLPGSVAPTCGDPAAADVHDGSDIGDSSCCRAFIGAHLFGGAITSILFNIPGEAWSVATTFDGYPMLNRVKPPKR